MRRTAAVLFCALTVFLASYYVAHSVIYGTSIT